MSANTETVLFAAQQILGESGHSAIANSLLAVIGEIKEREAAVADLMDRMDAYAHATAEIRKCPPYDPTPGHILHEAVRAQAEMFAALARCKGGAA